LTGNGLPRSSRLRCVGSRSPHADIDSKTSRVPWAHARGRLGRCWLGGGVPHPLGRAAPPTPEITWLAMRWRRRATDHPRAFCTLAPEINGRVNLRGSFMRQRAPYLMARHPYAWRTWLRGHLPWFLINMGVAAKGKDCEIVGAEHHYYNRDHVSSACYHCEVVRPGRLWRQPDSQWTIYHTAFLDRFQQPHHQPVWPYLPPTPPAPIPRPWDQWAGKTLRGLKGWPWDTGWSPPIVGA